MRNYHAIGLLLVAAACDAADTTVPIGQLSSAMPVLGQGRVDERYTGEVAVRGTVAYTTTWSRRGTQEGNAVKVWNVAGNTPVLVDSLILAGAGTLGDAEISDDGTLLVVASESGIANGIAVYRLTDPMHPQFIGLVASANTVGGVHTAKVARLNGRLYAFLSVNRISGETAGASRLVIFDITAPDAPVEVLAREMGNPFIHDVFVRDGILFTALWDDGLVLWDVGGGTRGGSIANPVMISSVHTLNGRVHNVWWYFDRSGAKRYAFVGEEAAGILGSFSSGDIHVVDLIDMSAPVEVAFYSVPGAGTHNFSVDEQHGVLYAAYYNGGVRAINVNGALGSCTTSQRAPDGRCDLGLMGRERGAATFTGQSVSVWGVSFAPPYVYASDMLNGLWKLAAFPD